MNALKLQRELASVIKKHCKKRPANEATTEDYMGDAAYIIHADRCAVARQRAWKPECEAARIGKIERALKKVVEDIRKLPEPLQIVLNFDARPIDAAPEGAVAALGAIRVGIESAKALAASGEALNVHDDGHTGRARAGAVLWECRIVWKRQTGRRAPRNSNANLPGPFGEFVQEVFGILHIGFSARQSLELVNQARRKISHETPE